MNKEQVKNAFIEIRRFYGVDFFRNPDGVNNCLSDLIPGEEFKRERRIFKRIGEYGIYSILLDSVNNDTKGKLYIGDQCCATLIDEDGMQPNVAEEYIGLLSEIFWNEPTHPPKLVNNPDNESASTNSLLDENETIPTIMVSDDVFEAIKEAVAYDDKIEDPEYSEFLTYEASYEAELEKAIRNNGNNQLTFEEQSQLTRKYNISISELNIDMQRIIKKNRLFSIHDRKNNDSQTVDSQQQNNTTQNVLVTKEDYNTELENFIRNKGNRQLSFDEKRKFAADHSLSISELEIEEKSIIRKISREIKPGDNGLNGQIVNNQNKVLTYEEDLEKAIRKNGNKKLSFVEQMKYAKQYKRGVFQVDIDMQKIIQRIKGIKYN